MDFLKTLRSAAGQILGEVLELRHPGSGELGATGKLIFAAPNAPT